MHERGLHERILRDVVVCWWGKISAYFNYVIACVLFIIYDFVCKIITLGAKHVACQLKNGQNLLYCLMLEAIRQRLINTKFSLPYTIRQFLAKQSRNNRSWHLEDEPNGIPK